MNKQELYNVELAPELIVSKWINSENDILLEHLRGKVVAIHAFQMLCPGCVLHGIPQAKKLYDSFNREHVEVLGLHTVFEHHSGMKEESLRAFAYEFRIKFPIGIDKASEGSDIPKTMELYEMKGTPTWLLIDRKGRLRLHAFGQLDDLVLGSEITKLALEDGITNIDLVKKLSANHGHY